MTKEQMNKISYETVCDEMRSMSRRVRCSKIFFSLDVNTTTKEIKNIYVNWERCGNQTAEETKQFIEKLQKATKLADDFNKKLAGVQIVY